MKWKILIGFLVITLVAVFLILPEPELPAPTGRYTVGGTTFELAAKRDNDNELWIQVSAWYPSSIDNATRLSAEKSDQQGDNHLYMPYIFDELAVALSEQQGLPVFLFEDMQRSNTVVDAVIADGAFPVLVFNHGYGSYPKQNMTQFEQLASEGYIVLAIGHPGDSLVVKRLNGDIINQVPEAVIHVLNEEVKVNFSQDLEQMAQATTRESWHRALSDVQKNPIMYSGNQRFNKWVANTHVLLDALDDINTGSVATPLAGHLDINSVGMFGHSFGGAVAIAVANSRTDIKAAFNLDGPQFNAKPNFTLRTPSCFAYGDQSDILHRSVDRLNDQLVAGSELACSVTFKGAGHMNFSDLTYNPYLTYMGIIGGGDGYQIGQAINKVVSQFFDSHVKGIEQERFDNSKLMKVNI